VRLQYPFNRIERSAQDSKCRRWNMINRELLHRKLKETGAIDRLAIKTQTAREVEPRREGVQIRQQFGVGIA
jgi:hypothetical protein